MDIFDAFARTYGLRYAGQDNHDYQGMLPGSLGRSVTGSDQATKQSFKIFELEYVINPNASEEDLETVSLVVVTINIVPSKAHVFLNSKLNDTIAGVAFDLSQRYYPEGEMSRYFELYFPEGSQTEALSLFAPDVLQLVMSQYGQYDIEVNGSQLYLYSYTKAVTVQDLEKLLTDARTLAKAVSNNAPRSLQLTLGSVSNVVARNKYTNTQKFFAAFSIIPIVVTLVFGSENKDQNIGLFVASCMVTIVVAAVVWFALKIRHQSEYADYEQARNQYRNKT